MPFTFHIKESYPVEEAHVEEWFRLGFGCLAAAHL